MNGPRVLVPLSTRGWSFSFALAVSGAAVDEASVCWLFKDELSFPISPDD